jgi:hypothetical protein
VNDALQNGASNNNPFMMDKRNSRIGGRQAFTAMARRATVTKRKKGGK